MEMSDMEVCLDHYWSMSLVPVLSLTVYNNVSFHSSTKIHSSTNIIYTIQYNTNLVVFIFVLKKNEINNIKKAIEIG